MFRRLLICALLSPLTSTLLLAGDCSIVEAKRKIQNSECNVFTLSNDLVQFDVIPMSEGELTHFKAKGKNSSAVEYLIDCVYNTAGRWEGEAYSTRIGESAADKVSLTVTHSGAIPAAALEAAGVRSKDPIEIKIERTMTLTAGSTRVQINVSISNVGKSVAPAFTYFPRLAFSGAPPMKGIGNVCWFLPDSGNAEFFTPARGSAEMAETNYGEGANADHPFNRFTPGQIADHPRYESAGWAAVLTSAGPTFVTCDPTEFAFMQYSFFQEHAWEFALEPHTRAVDLKPGETVSCNIALAADPKNVPFGAQALSYEPPSVPQSATPGERVKFRLRVTAIAGKEEQAKAAFDVLDPSGKSVASRSLEATVKPFQFVDLSNEFKLPESCPSGTYGWTLKSVDGKAISSGKIDVHTPAELEAAKKIPSGSLSIAPHRLEQLKKGCDWSYVYCRGNKEFGGAHIALKFDPKEKTFTATHSLTLPDFHGETSVTFSAEERPQLKSFSALDPMKKHQVHAVVTNGKLIGQDQDGDPYEIPWHSDFLPSLATDFIVMAVDWSAGNSLPLRLFDEKVQDFLPPAMFGPDRTTRSIKVGSETVECTSVMADRARVWIDRTGRIVEVSYKDSPYRLRLGEAKIQTNQPEAAHGEKDENEEAEQAALEAVLKHPPVTGVVISDVISKTQAAKAGLNVGDIILKYDGGDVTTRSKLEEIKHKVPDSKAKVELQVLRGSASMTFVLAPGSIGIQTLDVVKGKPVDLVTAQYGSMGFGPGPRAAPSELENLARDKCGSKIPWIRNLADARKRSQEQNKVLFWWASPIHGSATYKIESWNDYLTTGLFTDPWLVAYINRNFIPYYGPLTEKQMESYRLGFMTAPGFVFLSPNGDLIHEVDGLSTISIEYFAKVFQKVLNTAQHPPQVSPPKDNSVSATFDYIEALLADFDPVRAATEAKKVVGTSVGDDRAYARYLYGRALQMLHKEAEAVDALQEAWEEAHNIRIKSCSLAEWGLTLLHAGHPDQALKVLRQPLSEFLAGPRAVEARYYEGVALHLLNRDQESRRIWKAAAEDHPDDPWAWRCAAEYEGIGPFDKGFDCVYWVPDELVKDLHHSTEDPAHSSAEAVRSGVRYLLENQSSDGGWNDTNYDFGGLRAMPNVRVAVTAICCEALLAHRETNPHAIDAAIERAWPYLIDKSKMTWDDKNEIIWAHMYRMNFFAAWLKVAPPPRREEILQQMQLIADAFAKSQNEQGFWRHEYENDFVTGSVLLSLKFAKDAGIVVNEDAIEKGIQVLDKMRSPRGTFPYGDKPTDGPMAWKGCTGRTVNAEAGLLSWGRNSAERLREAIDQYVRWNFVQERVRKETFHTEQYMIGGFFFWYNMHVLSQAVRLTDNDTARRAARSMRDVVLKSREFDGTWIDSYDLGKSYATGMALLVLGTADQIER